jgi:hypothetical protein
VTAWGARDKIGATNARLVNTGHNQRGCCDAGLRGGHLAGPPRRHCRVPGAGLAALIGATADGPALTDGSARASARTRRS